MTENRSVPTTNDAGTPVESDEHSLTVGPDGPVLLQDHYLIEQMANFNRERIPERQPHAKGGGAFGHFEVTNDVSAYTKAAVFQPGTRTDTLIRFSTVAGERGSAAAPSPRRPPAAHRHPHRCHLVTGTHPAGNRFLTPSGHAWRHPGKKASRSKKPGVCWGNLPRVCGGGGLCRRDARS